MNEAHLERLGYAIDVVLSAGPTTFVALARGPDGAECVVKTAAISRAIPALQNEEAALQALAHAGVAGVPRVLHAWTGGFALERLALPTLCALGDSLRSSLELRDASVRRSFQRLAEVHAAKDAFGAPLRLVHGDVSPDNVYVARDGSCAALADFGLARWSGGPREGVEAGAFSGTLSYAAPEVARGEPFDGRADDFALAASLLHAATGIPLRSPGSSDAAMLVDAGSRPLDASHPWRPLIRKLFNLTVGDTLLACLAFDPRDRPRETPRPC